MAAQPSSPLEPAKACRQGRAAAGVVEVAEFVRRSARRRRGGRKALEEEENIAAAVAVVVAAEAVVVVENEGKAEWELVDSARPVRLHNTSAACVKGRHGGVRGLRCFVFRLVIIPPLASR